jgi:hypothetical protein
MIPGNYLAILRTVFPAVSQDLPDHSAEYYPEAGKQYAMNLPACNDAHRWCKRGSLWTWQFQVLSLFNKSIAVRKLKK